jgi:hypothetical protein
MATDSGIAGEDGEDADKYADWYEASAALSQGSILRGIFVFEESKESEEGKPPRVVRRQIDAVVLTQSCDIDKPPQTRLLVAEVQTYRALATAHGEKVASKGYRKELLQGRALGEFLLPPAHVGPGDWSVVNFRELHTVDRDRAKKTGDGLIGLRSPYREHLAQAFARFVMRVGLPNVLGNEFEKYEL